MNVKSRHHWSRRSALQTLALGSSSVAFLGSAKRELSLAGGPAAAAQATPKRLLIIFNGNGIRHDGRWSDWLTPGTSDTDFKTSTITAPLEKHRSELVFFDNMFFGTNVDWGDTHFVGFKAVLTAAQMVAKDGSTIASADPTKCKPKTASVDYYLGQKIGQMVTPQWPSMQLNLQMPGEGVSYATDGTLVPHARSPWDVYAKMFANLPDGGKVTPDPGLMNRVLRRRSVLDAVAGDVADFKKRLPAEDRLRADAQLDAIRTLEQRLAAGGRAPGQGCAAPPFGVGTKPNPDDTKAYPQLIRASSELAVAAFACDLTRFAMIGWRAGGGARPLCNFDPINSTHYDHEMSHDFLDEFVRLKVWYMNEVVALLDRLKQIPEGNGTMLDNTIVLWTTEISMGHQHGRMPWFTAGGKNLGVRTGRYLKLPTVAQNQVKTRSYDKGYPHARLFVSLLNAMGLPDDTFGIPEFGKGPMEGYLAG